MRYRGPIRLRIHGAGLYQVHQPGGIWGAWRTYCTQPPPPPRDYGAKAVEVRERTKAVLQNLTDLGKEFGRRGLAATSASATYWWGRYEHFVGLNEVREAQTQVTEAEKIFMVARGVVREAHGSLEALLARLKEVRDKLDRVSREEAHYLELATMEHKLLQEERRLRAAYESAESSEREKFALFSASVRESHERERVRAERTKNWSVIGSVLGAVIGVMGSTYVNRVRLLELRSLLLEAQKGPASLQETLRVQAGMHRAQQDELRGLINTLRTTLSEDRAAQSGQAELTPASAPAPAPTPAPAPPATTLAPAPPAPAPTPAPAPPASPSPSERTLQELVQGTQRSQALLQRLGPQLGQVQQGVSQVGAEVEAVRTLVERLPAVVVEQRVIQTPDAQRLLCDTESVVQGLGRAEERLETQINRTVLYNTVLTYTAFALTVPVLYVLFRGT